MSDVYNILHPQTPLPNNFQNMITNLRQFATTINGNPEQIVRNLLDSGRMTPEQYQKLSQQASQIQQMMRGF